MSTGSSRRQRLAHLIVTERLARYHRRPFYVRAGALGLLLALGLLHVPAALLMLVPAAVALVLRSRSLQRQREHPGRWASLWIVASVLLIVKSSWIDSDLSPLLRSLSLAAAMAFTVSVLTSIFVAPTWYDPDSLDRPALEILRRVAGPVSALVAAALVLPAGWPPGYASAFSALACLPVLVGARIWNTDHTLRNAVPLVREEAQRGRDQILREIHGALSTELRQLEQYARDYRRTIPELYELAVNANSGLRESLTLADELRDTSTTTDTLMAPVLTLTRAEGASATARIEIGELDPRDRELTRYSLNELVGDALRAEAMQLHIQITRLGRDIQVEVTDNRRPLPPAGDPADFGSGSILLELKLAPYGGMVTRESRSAGRSRPWTTRVLARWQGHR